MVNNNTSGVRVECGCVYHFVMEVDADKLVFLVQARPVLYDCSLKEYHDSNLISKMWEEIGLEMNVPGK